MASELKATANNPPGTAYFQVVRRDGQIMKTDGTFEAYLDAHWTSYAIPATQQGTGPRFYGNMPGGVAADLLDVTLFRQAGGSPAIGDAVAAEGPLNWNGSTDVDSADVYARLGTPAGASVSADIAAVKSDTATILTDVNTGAGAIYTRLGAPAGASIAADIAAVEAHAAAVDSRLPTSPAAVSNIPAATANADALLARSIAGGADGGRTVQDALRAGRNKVAFDVPATGQFTVYQEDDATPAWTGTYTRGSVSTGPLTGVDPS